MAVVLLTFAKNMNKSSRAVAWSAVMDREPPSFHCLITRWGLSFINIHYFKMCVGGQVSDLKIEERKKWCCLAPLHCVETVSCSLAMTEWPSEGIWCRPVTECIHLPCDTDMRLNLAELKGEGEMVHSKWMAILPVTVWDPGRSMPGLLCNRTVTVLPQSLLGWPTFFFSCKGCAHLLTFFPPFLSPTIP